jgi:hypothetical protein
MTPDPKLQGTDASPEETDPLFSSLFSRLVSAFEPTNGKDPERARAEAEKILAMLDVEKGGHTLPIKDTKLAVRAIPGPQEPEAYVGVKEACRVFEISRRTFDRLLGDLDSGLSDIIVRIPPRTGRIKVPLRGFLLLMKKLGKRGYRRQAT